VVILVGNASENDAPVSGTLFGLESVKVIVEVPFAWIVAGKNDLAMVGAPSTSKFAEPGAPPTTLV